MATAARHAHSAAPAPRYERDAREEAPYAYRAPRTRKRAAQRSRLMRTFVIFVGCLTVLAVGRVALSFAVVQKTLQTDAIVREERRISDKNDQLEEQARAARLAGARAPHRRVTAGTRGRDPHRLPRAAAAQERR